MKPALLIYFIVLTFASCSQNQVVKDRSLSSQSDNSFLALEKGYYLSCKDIGYREKYLYISRSSSKFFIFRFLDRPSDTSSKVKGSFRELNRESHFQLNHSLYRYLIFKEFVALESQKEEGTFFEVIEQGSRGEKKYTIFCELKKGQPAFLYRSR